MKRMVLAGALVFASLASAFAADLPPRLSCCALPPMSRLKDWRRPARAKLTRTIKLLASISKTCLDCFTNIQPGNGYPELIIAEL